VVPQGARSGRAGGAVAIEGGIALSLLGLASVDVDPVQGIAVCGPGVVNADLKRAANAEGLHYAPDPASSSWCTIGGNVATNAGGLCCVKYGVTADHVLGLQVVLPGGEVIRTGRRTAKGVAGYDLTGLFVGSEGTLGVVTEVVARLIPRPAPALTALATFDSLDAAARAILALRADPHRPSIAELLDGASIAAVQQLGDYGYPEGTAAALLVQSDRDGHTREDVGRYADLLTEAGATEVAVADDAAEADALMEGRRVVSTALETYGARMVEDVCVPVARLTELIDIARRVCDEIGVRVAFAGHAGDGNLHPSLFFDRADPASRERAERANEAIVRAALGMGGTISGEHGIGSVKAGLLPLEVAAADLARHRRIKAVFDPSGIMNPGRVLLPA
jgi:glycolate oxidase